MNSPDRLDALARRAAHAVSAAAHPFVDESPPVAQLERTLRSRQRRRAGATIGGLAALAALAVVGIDQLPATVPDRAPVISGVPERDAATEDTTAPDTPAAEPERWIDATRAPAAECVSEEPANIEPFVDGWSELVPPPAPRARASVLWVGGRLLMIGGDTGYGSVDHRSVFAYDPDLERWDCLDPGPPRSGGAPAVQIDDEVYVVAAGTAAALDPVEGAWRELADPPLPTTPLGAVWSGSELLVLADNGEVAAYDPTADRWRTIGDSPYTPPRSVDVGVVWTGTEMLVRGARQGVAYDPATDTWRELPSFSVSANAYTIAWDGHRLITYDYELKAGAYDPATDEWTRLPDLPLQFGECYPDSAVLDDGRFLAWYCGQAALLDPATDTWTQVETPITAQWMQQLEPAQRHAIVGTLVAAGDVIYFAGAGHEGHANHLWRYDPATGHERRTED